jgi:hypothetical protein
VLPGCGRRGACQRQCCLGDDQGDDHPYEGVGDDQRGEHQAHPERLQRDREGRDQAVAVEKAQDRERGFVHGAHEQYDGVEEDEQDSVGADQPLSDKQGDGDQHDHRENTGRCVDGVAETEDRGARRWALAHRPRAQRRRRDTDPHVEELAYEHDQ